MDRSLIMSRLAALAVVLASVGSAILGSVGLALVAEPAPAGNARRVPVWTSPGDATMTGPSPRGLGVTGGPVPVRDRAGMVICSVPVVPANRGCPPSSSQTAGGHRLTPVWRGDPVAIPVIDAAFLAGDRVTVSGSGEPGSVITVTGAGGALLCQAVVPEVGRWSCTGPLIRGPLRAVAADRAGRTSAQAVVADADLSIDVALREPAGAGAVVVMIVANHGSAATGPVTVTLGLPPGLVATGTAAGARCSGLRLVTCIVGAHLVAPAIEEVGPAARAAPPGVGPADRRPDLGRGSDPDRGPDVGRGSGVDRGPAWPHWRIHLYEGTATATVAVPVRLAGPCAATWPGGPLTAAVTSQLLDLDRANNAASVPEWDSSLGRICATSVRHSSPSIWMNVYVGLIVAALATLIALSFRFRPPGRRP